MSTSRPNDRASGNRLRTAPTPNVSVRRTRRPWAMRLSAWRQSHRDGIVASLRRLVARPWATLLTVLVIGIALALPLLFHVVLDNARQLAGGLREAREITVFLQPSADAAKANAFAETLRARADVAAVTVRTPEQGLAEFRQLSGFAEALDVLEHNPLPSVLVVTPRHADADSSTALLVALKADARTDMVQYDAAWRQRLAAVLRFGERAMLALLALLAVATLLIVGNTVRMDIQGRAEEIAVSQLIGANDAFVRRPFLYSGMWYGLLGGLLALAAVGLIESTLAEPARQLLASYQNRFDLLGFGSVEALAVIGTGIVLGWLGAWVVSTGHLRAGRAGR